MLDTEDDDEQPDADPVEELPAFHLWPEHLTAWLVFQSCGTQWNWSWRGREGLIYSEVRAEIRSRGHRGRRADEIFRHVREIEWGAVDAWNEARAEEAANNSRSRND